MKNKKLLGLSTMLIVGTAVVGQQFISVANTPEPGTSDDPVITESYMKQELGKLQKEIATLEGKVSTLEKKVETLSSSNGNTSGGGTSNGGTTNGGTSNGGTTNGGTTTTPAYIGTGIVNTTTLNVRSGAGTNYSKVGSLSSGTKVNIISKSGTWYKISYGNITGYVSGDYLKVTLTNSNSSSGGSTTTTKTGVVTVASLNVRKGPGTSYAKVGSVKNNQTVTILGTSGSWTQIKTSTLTGWVSSEYIKVK